MAAALKKAPLLFLGHVLPYPPDSGVAIRSYHTLRLLAQEFDVTALCFYRRRAQQVGSGVDRNVAVLREMANVEAFPIPQEQDRFRLATDHARSLLRLRPYTYYAYDSAHYRDRLRDYLASAHFEMVHVDSLDLCASLPLLDPRRTVLVHHNVESRLMRRRAAGERSGNRRRYMSIQAGLLERMERRWLDRVRLNIAVSDDDARDLRSLAHGADVMVIPNGVDTEYFSQLPDSGTDIVFIGGLEWFPNVDAMEWFGAEVLPLLRARGFNGRVRWIGRASEEEQRWSRERFGIEATGYVDDVRELIRTAACTVVPLRIGGGTRLKITTAWSLGKAIVSTSIGCEGLRAIHGENILIADTAQDMALEIQRLLDDAALRRRLGEAGRSTAETGYDWSVVGAPMIVAYRRIIDEGASAGS